MSRAPDGAAIRAALWPGMAALIAFMGLGRFAYTPILPEMLAAGVLDLRGAGWVASANFLGYLVGAIGAAAVRDRGLQARLARASMAATVAALAAMAVTDGVLAWLLVRFAAGVASAVAMVFVSAQVLERMTAIGAADRTIWLYASVGVGIAGSAAMSQAVHAADGAWTHQWLAAAVAAALFTAAAWRGSAGGGSAGGGAAPGGRESGGRESGGRESGGEVPADRVPGGPVPVGAAPAAAAVPAPRAYRATVLAYGLFGFGYVIHATYLPAMVREAGYSPAAASWVWVLVGLVALPSFVAWRALARRWGSGRAIAAGYALEGTTALATLAEGSIVAAGVAAIGLGATFLPVTGLALPHARALAATGGARAIGVMTAAFGIGQIVGPIVAAQLAAGRGFGVPSLVAAVALFAAAVLMRLRLDAPAPR
jgi:MFS family permease